MRLLVNFLQIIPLEATLYRVAVLLQHCAHDNPPESGKEDVFSPVRMTD